MHPGYSRVHAGPREMPVCYMVLTASGAELLYRNVYMRFKRCMNAETGDGLFGRLIVLLESSGVCGLTTVTVNDEHESAGVDISKIESRNGGKYIQ